MPRGLAEDNASAPVAPTPPRGKDHSTKRKETLRTLLTALEELSKDDSEPEKGKPVFEDDRDVPTVDEHLQRVGAEEFYRFQRRATNLDKELRNFSNAARQLGSSVGILSSAFRLRERLAHVLHLFHENAADLFPRKIQHHVKEPMLHPFSKPSRKKMKKPPPNVALPAIAKDLDLEDFPNQFSLLAQEVVALLNCLNEFPEFTDEAVNASIQSFEVDLKYWASCLEAYQGQFRYPAVQRYLHDLTGEMSEQLDAITASLAYFTEVGVPTIRLNQKHGAANLQNLTTVATFFSAVTATTLQFSYELVGDNGGHAADAVNAFWFASLVFSIASAVNSLLGLTWKQAMYRSPGHRVPWWVLIWIKRSPLVFLVISVASFSIGLVLFAYASSQSHVTIIITTAFTGLSSFGLVAVSAWFASERWAYAHHKGQKWLADVLEDVNHRLFNLPPIKACAVVGVGFAKHGKKSIKRSNTALSNAGSRAKEYWVANVMNNRPSEDSLPTSQPTRSLSPVVQSPTMTPEMSARRISHSRQASMGSPMSEKDSPLSPTGDGIPELPMLTSPARTRFASLVRAAVLMRRSTAGATPALMLTSPARQRTASSSRFPTMGPVGVKTSRLAALTPKLRSLEPTQDLAAHQALVRHLQFSPDGKYLATSSWDRTSVIFRVGEPFKQYRVLAHPQGFVGQVAWSPDVNGGLLMTKLGRGMKIWTQDGVCKKTISRHRTVCSVTWLSKDAFLSVEGSEVVKIDLNGKILDTYQFDRLDIYDVAVTMDGLRLLAVGSLQSSKEGYKPSKSRAEKRILVYNMAEKEIESQVPVLNDVRDITLSKDGKGALVSYENKAPPQLWKLDMLKDKESTSPDDKNARLVLRHTYMPKAPVDFAGPSYFGGKDDHLVLCAGKAGDIHIWDRESATLLHHVRAQASGGDLTCIAWNHAAEDPFMFVTGSHDGAVRVWTTPPPDAARQSLRDSQSFIIDVRAPSPTGSAYNPIPSPVASLSPPTSGRTSPIPRGAQSLFAPDMPYNSSPVTDTFGLTANDMGDIVRQAIARSRPGSPERDGGRRALSRSRPGLISRPGSTERGDGRRAVSRSRPGSPDDPSTSQRRVFFQSPKSSSDS